MRTLAVINHKGGAGKTTTSVNLTAAMGETGLKVLLLDLDPQGSASDWVGAHDDSRGMFDVFVGSVELSTLAQRTIVPGLDIIPASPWLVTAERTLLGDLAASFVRAVSRLPADWDVVVADCPPSIAFLSVAALAAFREVLIPVETHAIALPGVASLVREMDQIRATLNPGLGSPHILAGRVNRTVHSREVLGRAARDLWRHGHARDRPRQRPPGRGQWDAPADHPERPRQHGRQRLPGGRGRGHERRPGHHPSAGPRKSSRPVAGGAGSTDRPSSADVRWT